MSSLSRKLSVLQASSTDNMARQHFQGFNICTDFLMPSTPATTRQSSLVCSKEISYMRVSLIIRTDCLPARDYRCSLHTGKSLTFSIIPGHIGKYKITVKRTPCSEYYDRLRVEKPFLFILFFYFLSHVCVQWSSDSSLSWSTYIDKPSHCVIFIIGIGIHSDKFPCPHN